MIVKGLSYTSKMIVGEKDTAENVGSGTLKVLATPSLAALMENAAMNAVASEIEQGQTTVGSSLAVAHLCPTAVGKEVEAKAVLVDADGRKLCFEIEARELDGTLIGTAKHTRYIVNADRFMKKLFERSFD